MTIYLYNIYNPSIPFAALMNKVPVTVGDGPGFVVNRVAGSFYGMAGHILVLGGASVRRIDKLMTNMGFPAGPFALIDGVGLPTAYKVSQWLGPRINARGSATLTHLLKTMVSAGWLGRTHDGTSRGFYNWQGGHQAGINNEVRDGLDSLVLFLNT